MNLTIDSWKPFLVSDILIFSMDVESQKKK